MPAPTSAIPSSSSKHITAKKSRPNRRRGRRPGAADSDEEIEREALTDSESESDTSSIVSDPDSDEEDNDDEELPKPTTSNGRMHPDQSKKRKKDVKDQANSKEKPSFFAQSNNWSDMVAEDDSKDLPVLDFADLDSHKLDPNSPQNPSDSTTHPLEQEPTHDQRPKSPASRKKSLSATRRPPGHSARQAYQQRLESDPSYIPTVGEFWGHDDRLLDKDLRSLSGWWRGRWQGRGRGGFSRGFARGRGRPLSTAAAAAPESPAQQDDIAPVEKPWTHDGFEEMKQTEEKRRAVQAVRGSRGRGVPKFARGGFTRGRGGQPFVMGKGKVPVNSEQAWTKQPDPVSSAQKPSGGNSFAIRVKLPGNRGHFVRSDSVPVSPPIGTPAAVASTLGSEPDDKAFVVRIPAGKHKQRPTKRTGPLTPPAETTQATRPPPLSAKTNNLSARPASALSRPVEAGPSTMPNTRQTSPLPFLNTAPLPEVAQQLQNLSLDAPEDPERLAQTESAVMRQPDETKSASERRASLPPIQTVFPPPPMQQPTPPYGSPYAYPQPLPPGIAVDPNGYPFEVSTGRPVYLPPPQMYNPRPMMHAEMVPHGIPYSHSRHHSTVSSEFYAAHSPSPPVNGIVDPVTGAPIFIPRRSSHRVEIRAPEAVGHKGESTLRSNASAFEPAISANYPPVDYHLDAGYHNSYPNNPSMMGYAQYPQQYYYPEGYVEPYPYPAPYVDHTGTVYYHH